MGIMRIDPIKGLETISKKMSDFMNEFEKGVSLKYGAFAPRIDIIDAQTKKYVQTKLPGIAKEDVKLKINSDGVLCISGEKKRCEKCCENKDSIEVVRIERSFGAFNRSFQLPENIDKDSIKAKFENGVLEITLDKIEPEKPKEVHVEIQ